MSEKILTLGIVRDYILERFPDLLWWDGYTKHEPFNKNKSYKHRHGMPNEIRIEFDYDDINKSWEASNDVCLELNKLRYSFAVYYTEGGRGPHIHIYDLDELESLDCEQRTEYRKRFIKSVSGKWEADFGLCEEKHLCALEFAHHFKYNKPKRLIMYCDNGINMGIDLNIKLDILFQKKKKSIIKGKDYKNIKFGDMIRLSDTDIIIKQCSFEKVFGKYNVKYKGHMALCPFHNDTNYSLSFSNKKGLWKCFGSGCESKGNVFTLIKMLRELKK